MASTQDYSASKIVVSSQTIQDTSQTVAKLSNDIASQIEDILNTLAKLDLTWVGSSQQLANQFNQEWQSAIATLFGTQKNPGQGVMNQVAIALADAASNYAAVEFNAESTYLDFVAGFLTPSSSNASSTPQSVENQSGQITTAITEIFS